uniref:RWD domain-containing protein 1 n=1 Tax=Ornithorhynchus anatinus TaxID=9258 RepID=A0A6I8NZ24_ORNAN
MGERRSGGSGGRGACAGGGASTMTDYSEEQRNELEALQSIYPDSFTVLSENPTSFTITVTSEAGENDETVQTALKFTYGEKYPDEPPHYEIFSQENLEDNDISDILKLLELQAEENLGMVMIFTLVSAVQEKLNEIVDQIKNRREEELKQKEKEAEEAEKQCFHGTPVTIENFLSWKAKFDAELLEIKRKRMKEEEQAGKNKLSGRLGSLGGHGIKTGKSWGRIVPVHRPSALLVSAKLVFFLVVGDGGWGHARFFCCVFLMVFVKRLLCASPCTKFLGRYRLIRLDTVPVPHWAHCLNPHLRKLKHREVK